MKSLLLALTVLLFGIAPLAAPAAAQDNGGRLALTVGYFDIFDDDEALDVGVEYRSGTPCFWEIKPFITGHINSEGSAYALGGIYGDIGLSDEWTLTPSLGAGLYGDGEGKDLGHTLVFRTQVELGYSFQNGSRLAGALSHMSNGGLDSHNPGTEMLTVNYSFPLQWFQSPE